MAEPPVDMVEVFQIPTPVLHEEGTADNLLLRAHEFQSMIISADISDSRVVDTLQALNQQIIIKLHEVSIQGEIYNPNQNPNQNQAAGTAAGRAVGKKGLVKHKVRRGRPPQMELDRRNASLPIVKLSQKQERPLEEKRFKCGVCGYRAVRKDAVQQHMKIHTSEKPFKCHICDYSTRFKGDLPKHIRCHTGEKPYRCAVCGYSSNQASSLRVHMRIHTGERPYKCSLCDYTGTVYEAVRSHIKSQHTPSASQSFDCHYCDFHGRTKFNLQCHIKKEHEDLMQYECTVCNQKLADPKELEYHLKMKHKFKNHGCAHCDFMEVCSEEDWKAHSASHGPAQGCELCDSGVQHTQNDGPNPYQCDKCEFKAAKCYELNAHKAAEHLPLKIDGQSAVVNNEEPVQL